MKKYILGLLAGAMLAMGGAASADCVGCEQYNVKLNVNGNPFFGKWAIVNDRPYVGVEAFSDAVGVPRAHYYKGWSLAKTPAETIGPLELLVMGESAKLDTIRFAGVTMIDLYSVADALDLPVHHNFNSKTIQVGSNYTGENIKGAWYRHLSRARGWTDRDFLERLTKQRRIEFDSDHGPSNLRRL